MIFFTADTHFGQQRTLELSKRPFDSVLEMDTIMIDNWHELIRPYDIVYHLGDFGNTEMIHQLDGEIKFLPGNYDNSKIISDLSLSCDIIKPNTIVTEYNLKLVHEPDEAIGNNFYLFGHIHKLQMIKRNGLNVGVDCHNFAPISLDDVLFYKNAIQNHYDENVFMERLGKYENN